MLVDATGLTGVKFSYTGGERGWRGDIPQVRFDITKMKKLGWKPKYTSNEAVSRAIKDIVEVGLKEKDNVAISVPTPVIVMHLVPWQSRCMQGVEIATLRSHI